MKKVVYTALTGSYDALEQHKYVNPEYDYICFSNDFGDKKKIGIWTIRKIDYPSDDKQLQSRFPKLQPHEVLPEYEISLYVDANVNILTPYLFRRIDELMKEGVKLAGVEHQFRDCLYEEGYRVWIAGVGAINLHLIAYSRNLARHGAVCQSKLGFCCTTLRTDVVILLGADISLINISAGSTVIFQKVILIQKVIQRYVCGRIQIDFVVRLELFDLRFLRIRLGQKGKRLGCANRQGINPGLSLLLHQQNNSLNDGIFHICRQICLIDHNVIADLVDRKRPTITVKDLTARSINALYAGIIALRHLLVFLCVDNLILHQLESKRDKHNHNQ